MWRSTFLSAYDGTCSDRSDKDACAAKIAWASVKTKYKKGEGDKWVSKAGDPVVGPVTPVPDIEGVGSLYGDGLDPDEKGTKKQQWRAEFKRALAEDCQHTDDPEGCARASANAAVGNQEVDMDEDAVKERRTFTAEQKAAMIAKGEAMPDGTFPIASCNDLGNAVMSLGRTVNPTSDVVRHITKRARELGCHLPLRVSDKMHAVERYVERAQHRKAANATDFQHIATIGDSPIYRPEHIESAIWRNMIPDQRTVKAEAIRRIIERNYAQAVEDAEMSGWKPRKSHYDPEEYYFTKRWPTGDPRAPQVTVRSVLVREADSLDWQLRPVSSFASGTLAEKMPAGIVRHVKKDRINVPLMYRGGPGSGHFGHAGREGEVGGSQPSSGGPKSKGAQFGTNAYMEEQVALYEEAGMLEDAPDDIQTYARKKREREDKGQSRAEALAERLPEMSLSEIASKIRRDWGKVNFAAVPYLEAMGQLESISDSYYADTGMSVVAYFLSNAGTWKGDTARAVKKELNRRLKAAR
jgi:hypothetical protein